MEPWRARTVAIGRRAELRAARILQRDGYRVSRFVGSRGPFDLLAICGGTIRLVQVKLGGYLKRSEREHIAALALPAGTSTECWRFPTLSDEPIIEAPIAPPGPRRETGGPHMKPCTAPGCPGVITEASRAHLRRRRYCSRPCANRATVEARTAWRRRLRTAA